MIPGSDSDHADLVKSFGFAVQGLRTALATERNIRIMLGFELAVDDAREDGVAHELVEIEPMFVELVEVVGRNRSVCRAHRRDLVLRPRRRPAQGLFIDHVLPP